MTIHAFTIHTSHRKHYYPLNYAAEPCQANNRPDEMPSKSTKQLVIDAQLIKESHFSHSCCWLSLRDVWCDHLTLSPIRFTAQFDLAALNRYSYDNIQTASLGTARWAHHSTSHHKARAWYFMWLGVVTCAEIALPPMLYAYNVQMTILNKYKSFPIPMI